MWSFLSPSLTDFLLYFAAVLQHETWVNDKGKTKRKHVHTKEKQRDATPRAHADVSLFGEVADRCNAEVRMPTTSSSSSPLEATAAPRPAQIEYDNNLRGTRLAHRPEKNIGH